uniref:Odorant receptor n=1 Tax=Globodera rostochiensis TaxID=31243 RepID=A0A914ICG5_GLORO
MEVFFFHPEEYDRLYNCSAYSIDQIPLEKRQHILIGVIFLSIGIICEVLYIPCMIAIRKHMDNTCYKFMFYISIMDMLCLTLNAITTGILAICGAVFCTSPRFIYIAGAFGLSLWGCETVAEMSLALNRCLELAWSRVARVLFHGKQIYLWMLFPTVYGLYFLIFTKPIIFSGMYITWFFNPHIGYINDYEIIYRNDLHAVHNYIVIIVLSSTYLTFAMIFFVQGRQFKTLSTDTGTVYQKQVFIQVILISSSNAIAAAICVFMNFVSLSEFLIILGQFCWIMAHGLPPIIYLLLNKTVRRDVYIMLVRHLAVMFPWITVPPELSSTLACVNVGQPTFAPPHLRPPHLRPYICALHTGKKLETRGL